MRIVQRLALAGSIGVTAGLSAAPPAHAAEPINNVLAETNWRDTQRARAVLADDNYLRGFNLGVRVENGAAHLWGPVPDVRVAERAAERLRTLTQIRSITDATHLQIADETAYGHVERQRSRPVVDAGLPLPVITLPLPDPEVTTWFHSGSTPRLSATYILPARPVLLPTPSVVRAAALLLPPEAPNETDQDIRTAVKNALMKDERFRSIQYVIQEGVVTLTGDVPRWEDLWLCADCVARLRGVERVVIGVVRSK